MDATPGLADGAHEFYSVAGAERMARVLPSFTGGRAVIGVCGAPFKCPPAPSEAALLLHDYLSERELREACEITFVIPLSTPVPPSPETSRALEEAFAARGIELRAGRRVAALETERGVAILDDGGELPYELFLGVPRHHAPEVVRAAGLVEDVYIPVNPRTLETRHPGVYAVGDVAAIGVPKAGVFAEGSARVVARELIARIRGDEPPAGYDGRGSCYIEFGAGSVGRVDVDFLSGPKPTGAFHAPSRELVAEKRHFGASRRARWFGREEQGLGAGDPGVSAGGPGAGDPKAGAGGSGVGDPRVSAGGPGASAGGPGAGGPGVSAGGPGAGDPKAGAGDPDAGASAGA
jgi:sulfide:quinone oxidoreductase